MNDLQIVAQRFNGGDENCINARDLHKCLESKSDFSTWIKRRIQQCNFIGGVDYVSLTTNVEREVGATRKIDFFISFDMAKHLCMLEKSKRGHETRMYFIEQEKIARKIQTGLYAEFNAALVEYEKWSDLASQAGRTLVLVGKKLKPQSLEKVEELK